MERARLAALAALFVVLSVGGAAALAAGAGPAPQVAPVTWPTSSLLVSEVQTGGASASDEFVEITNVGAGAVDLAGLEIAYATSSGSTVTRKASWASTLLLGSGQHLLVANTSGTYAGLADATYSGGFAATGGALVLRAIGGAPVDSVGWGDATNAFVEGGAAPAPTAGASIERKPGGIAGNTVDTNDNAADWSIQAAPNPQSLASPPVPAPGASPMPAPTTGPTPLPTAAPTPEPTGTPGPTQGVPTPVPTLAPTPGVTTEPSATLAPTPLATPEPTLEPTQAPSPTPMPTPDPTSTPDPTPEPTPVPTIEPTLPPIPTPTPGPTDSPAPTEVPTPTPLPFISIAEARALADGSTARIVGVLTTALGALEDGRKAFVQDATGGIALYLEAAAPGALPAGARITVLGTIDARFAERTLRADLTNVTVSGELVFPAPITRGTGTIDESVEGLRVRIEGVTVGSASQLADGLGLMVDDGSGQVRVIVGPAALGGATVPSGTPVFAIGPVGQRDSSGTGHAGYRIHATEAGEFGVVAPPSPEPTSTPAPTPSSAPSPSPAPSLPTPAPSAAPTPRPTLTPAPTRTPAPSSTPLATAPPSPTPSPTATPGPTPPPIISILEARGAKVGTVVTVAGVVTAEAGRLGTSALVAIADGSGGIAVRLPDGVAAPTRGTTLSVKGALADPYGQLEIRPKREGIRVTGRGSLPAPLRLGGANLGEATEGRLAEITGTLAAAPRKGSGGDLTLDVVDTAGTHVRVVCDGSSRIEASHLAKGASYRLTGIVGQRASRRGALDGYRLHLRDRADIAAVTGPGGPGGPGPSVPPSAAIPIAKALAMPDGTTVVIEATVSAGASLLDSSRRRIIVQDASGAIEVLLPGDSTAPAVGKRLRITGRTGHAWGAPRLAATLVESLGGESQVTPKALSRPPAERDEWLLVRLSGTVTKVERLGDRWRAEIVLADRSRAAVHGQAGAGIPSTAIVVGRRLTVTGIVKRPYPTANDRRFAVLPRGRGDLSIGPGEGGSQGGSGGSQGGRSGPASSAGPGQAGLDVTPDTDLAALAEHVGRQVRVGGLIARLAGDGFDLDDGTALARVELRGGMTQLVGHLRRGEAIAATGTVALVAGAPVVVVGDEGSLVRVGTLGEALPIGTPASSSAPSPGPSGGAPAIVAGAGAFGTELAPPSLLAFAALMLASVIATILRRRLVQRRLREALVARLAGLATTGASGKAAGASESHVTVGEPGRVATEPSRVSPERGPNVA